MIRAIKTNTGQLLLLIALTIVSTLLLEHSQLDINISQLLYANGNWLIEKDAQPYRFIFYDAPKLLLILFSVYLLIMSIWRYWQNRHPNTANAKPFFFKPISALSSREIGYLLLVIIVVPTVIAALKGITHVSCPNHLYLFNGNLPYVSIWQDILTKTDAKCFPAAHASAGFALYGLLYLPTLKDHRFKIFIIVTALGWTMGLYKMLFGDHFFSHTLVSMLLAWAIACGIGIVFFAKANRNRNGDIQSD